MWKRKETSSLQWIKLRLWTNSIEEAKKQQQQIANLVQTSDSQGSILFGVFIIMNVKSVFFFLFRFGIHWIYLFIHKQLADESSILSMQKTFTKQKSNKLCAPEQICYEKENQFFPFTNSFSHYYTYLWLASWFKF